MVETSLYTAFACAVTFIILVITSYVIDFIFLFFNTVTFIILVITSYVIDFIFLFFNTKN